MDQQVSHFRVKTVRTASGERLPTLIDRATGLPVFDSVLWVVSCLRNRNYASQTISQALRSLVVLYIVFRSLKIDLTERFREGRYLDPSEIEAIAKAARQTVVSSEIAGDDIKGRNGQRNTNISPLLEKLRMPGRTSSRGFHVASHTTAIRMGYIRKHLHWRISLAIARIGNEKRPDLVALRDLVDLDLQNKTPQVTNLATLGTRMGIDRAAQAKLLSITSPTNPLNPWGGEFIRARNHFVIAAFLALGVRRSELLGIRIGDFNHLAHEVSILRRPDDPDDPRLDEPNAKTRDRVLPVTRDLYQSMKCYLDLRDDRVRGRHDFLVVANNGSPLSKSEVNQILSVLVKKRPELPHLHPHILRHSFCENLADDLCRAGMSDDQIMGYLRQLGGWSDKSDSPLRYTKRFAQERAAKAGIALQKNLGIGNRPSGD